MLFPPDRIHISYHFGRILPKWLKLEERPYIPGLKHLGFTGLFLTLNSHASANKANSSSTTGIRSRSVFIISPLLGITQSSSTTCGRCNCTTHHEFCSQTRASRFANPPHRCYNPRLYWLTFIGGSSNGRTADSGSVCGGSNPPPPASTRPSHPEWRAFLIILSPSRRLTDISRVPRPCSDH
jgi:hypothetical protein